MLARTMQMHTRATATADTEEDRRVLRTTSIRNFGRARKNREAETCATYLPLTDQEMRQEREMKADEAGAHHNEREQPCHDTGTKQ